MTTQPSAVDLSLPAFTTVAERGRLRFFAQAIGQDDIIYSDLQAASDAGYADLPVPPTFLFSLERDGVDSKAMLQQLGVDMRQILHGEQSFVYHRVAVANEELHFAPKVVDDYYRRNGALRFLVRETFVTSQGSPVAEMRNVIVVRNAELP